ncbi:MAG: class I SAM-dependent methyltransferase [Cyanobacteria bacterium P01_A01_bin.3]
MRGVESTDLKSEYPKSELPEGRAGDWVLERVTVPPLSLEQQRSDRRPEWARSQPGDYTCLRCGHEVFMTDLVDEWHSQTIAFDRALSVGGHVLTTGLGLGMLVQAVLEPASSPVESVTIIERSRDVIALVAPHLKARYGDRVNIIQADAFSWTPPSSTHYSVIWHDIWPNPAAPQVQDDIKRLCERYRDWGDWQGAWATEFQAMAAK